MESTLLEAREDNLLYGRRRLPPAGAVGVPGVTTRPGPETPIFEPEPILELTLTGAELYCLVRAVEHSGSITDHAHIGALLHSLRAGAGAPPFSERAAEIEALREREPLTLRVVRSTLRSYFYALREKQGLSDYPGAKALAERCRRMLQATGLRV